MRKQRCLLLTDSLGESYAQEIRLQLANENLPVEVYHLNRESWNKEELLQLLSAQKIGTFLYIFAAWEMAEDTAHLAEDAGFSPEEMEWHGLGTRIKRVFCSACQELNAVGDETDITCRFCGEELSVSGHYSKRHRAFLGYTSIK